MLYPIYHLARFEFEFAVQGSNSFALKPVYSLLFEFEFEFEFELVRVTDLRFAIWAIQYTSDLSI